MDRSIDQDHSEVAIVGVCDLSAVALELNQIDSDAGDYDRIVNPRYDGVRMLLLGLNVVLLIVVIVMASR